MRRLLIVSPNFPPVNAPDMQRVRMSLPHFRSFGWEPNILAVDPHYVEGVQESLLLDTIPTDVPVHRTRAFDARWTRKFGIGALALRALPFLHRAGARLIRQQRPDLVYFSTTMFPTLVLGRVWKRKFNVPFVVDMQDPWVSDYYDNRPRAERPPKYALAQQMHRVLEPFTMKAVDGIIAVSAPYHETLRQRYPWISPDFCRTIPFGASELDFEIVGSKPYQNPFFARNDGLFHGVYVGRGGKDMRLALRGFFKAFQKGLEAAPEMFRRVRLHFVGTDYATPDRVRATIEPVAEEYNLREYVREHPNRIPYFEALQLLADSDFLIVPGSDDPQYTASKIYPHILAKRPLLAVFHRDSSVVSVIEHTRAGTVVVFSDKTAAAEISEALLPAWTDLLRALPFTPQTDWTYFSRFLAPEMTRQQCELFDVVVRRHSRAA